MHWSGQHHMQLEESSWNWLTKSEMVWEVWVQKESSLCWIKREPSKGTHREGYTVWKTEVTEKNAFATTLQTEIYNLKRPKKRILHPFKTSNEHWGVNSSSVLLRAQDTFSLEGTADLRVKTKGTKMNSFWPNWGPLMLSMATEEGDNGERWRRRRGRDISVGICLALLNETG